MARIVVFGGTGYTGSNIAREAASRGHRVIAVSRTAPAEPIEGVTYETGAAEALAPRLIPGADAVVATLSPRGDMAGQLVGIYRELARLCAEAGVRYLQIGGFSSLRPARGAPRFAEGEIPEQFRDEALEGDATRAMLVEESSSDFDSLFISPAGSYGAFAAGERTGKYRVGDDVALFDKDGESTISGADFALAVVDEIENPAHHQTHIGIAY
jgi:uncharacterized protein